MSAPQPLPQAPASGLRSFVDTVPVATVASGAGVASALNAIAATRSARPAADGANAAVEAALGRFLDELEPMLVRRPTPHQRELLTTALIDALDARG